MIFPFIKNIPLRRSRFKQLYQRFRFVAVAFFCVPFLCSYRVSYAGEEVIKSPCQGDAGRVELACHTWTEIEKAQKEGVRTVIFPIGGTEQSGPYIAVGKHNIRAEFLADEIAQKLGHAFVAPVLPFVPEGGIAPRSSHMRFPGTISISPSHFEQIVKDVIESLRVQGFRLVVILGDHGGYQSQLAQIAASLNAAWQEKKNGAYVLFVDRYYRVIPKEYADFLRKKGYGSEVGLHAELSDTSLMLAVDPALVREDALKYAPKPEARDGVYGGDPRRANALLGRIGCEMQVQEALNMIMSFQRSLP